MKKKMYQWKRATSTWTRSNFEKKQRPELWFSSFLKFIRPVVLELSC